jgi:DNA-nicking Smr family endonuclease
MTAWSRRPPAMTFDLHGFTVLDATRSAEQFLRAQAGARRGAVVRLITGRGSHGGDAPIRTRVRSLLKRLQGEGKVVADFVLEDSEGSFLVRLSG